MTTTPEISFWKPITETLHKYRAIVNTMTEQAGMGGNKRLEAFVTIEVSAKEAHHLMYLSAGDPRKLFTVSRCDLIVGDDAGKVCVRTDFADEAHARRVFYGPCECCGHEEPFFQFYPTFCRKCSYCKHTSLLLGPDSTQIEA